MSQLLNQFRPPTDWKKIVTQMSHNAALVGSDLHREVLEDQINKHISSDLRKKLVEAGIDVT